MKDFKEKVLKEKEQPNIYMQKTQGPKILMSSPNIDQRFKSKTLLNKENLQPNLPMRSSKPLVQNSFGAAKIMMRQSVDDLKLNSNKQISNGISHKILPQMGKQNQQKYNLMSKSINFEKCATQRNDFAFSKKHLKTEEDDEIEDGVPIIEDCQMIKSEYESSDNSDEDVTLNFAKSYQRSFDRQNNDKHILVHESLDYDSAKPRQTVTFGPNADKNLKRYQFSREEEKKMKNQIINNIIMSSKAEMMRSCDFDNLSSLLCVNHNNKKAKYRLNNFMAEGEDESFYCSKCAVNIAKQGIDIEEISALDRRMIMSRRTERDYLRESVEIKGQKAKREEQFMSFQKRLELLKNKISAKLQLFTEKSEEMTKLDKKIQLTISNYDQLIEILKEMRKQEVEKEDQSRKQVNYLLSQKCLDINLKKHELSTILDNIKDTFFEINNEKTKMMALKNKDFSFMFDSYVNKIASYEEYLQNLEQTQLASDMTEFDHHLNSNDLDEENLLNAIFEEMYERLTQPKLEALAKSSKLRALKTEPIQESGMESGGSSMFLCREDQSIDVPQQKAFRKLFENSKAEEFAIVEKAHNLQMSNLSQSFNVNCSQDLQKSFQSVRHFKEENLIPHMNRYK